MLRFRSMRRFWIFSLSLLALSLDSLALGQDDKLEKWQERLDQAQEVWLEMFGPILGDGLHNSCRPMRLRVEARSKAAGALDLSELEDLARRRMSFDRIYTDSIRDSAGAILVVEVDVFGKDVRGRLQYWKVAENRRPKPHPIKPSWESDFEADLGWAVDQFRRELDQFLDAYRRANKAHCWEAQRETPTEQRDGADR